MQQWMKKLIKLNYQAEQELQKESVEITTYFSIFQIDLEVQLSILEIQLKP